MNDYILIANGQFLAKEIILEACKDKIIVALDGAINKLLHLGIKPHIVLGDFDSITPANHHATIVTAQDQNLTDLTKAVHYCDKQNAKSITLICALGGRLDHEENAKRTLRSCYRSDRPIYLHSEQQSMRFAKDETLTISGQLGDKCAILAFPKGAFTSHGLEYDVTDYSLDIGFSESISNALKQPIATISVNGEALIVMPPLLTSQRTFMSKSEHERLALLLRDCIG